MIERLVENWLDSINERDYQFPFCQILIAQGHRILHSTRHSPVELGKDIITIDSDGTLCAFQLKGNPGSRMTYAQYRGIEPQLRQLVDYQISHPSIRERTQHRSYLVTNGQIEEEAIIAINALNEGYIRDGFPNRKLEIIQRGDLLRGFTDLGIGLWPTEISDVKLLIELVASDGRGLISKEKIHHLLIGVLDLTEHRGKKLKAEAVRRRITSAALLMPIILKNYTYQKNHYAAICAWVMYCAYVVAACERHAVNFRKNAQASFFVGLNAIRESLIDLALEIKKRNNLIEGSDLSDPFVYRGRYTLILALLSLLWFWCNETGWPGSIEKDGIEKFLQEGREHLYCWGEGAIPQVLLYYWFLREIRGDSSHELVLSAIISGIIREDEKSDQAGLPPPYFDFEDVMRHHLSEILGHHQDPLRREAIGKRSFYAESLLYLLVRTGRKRLCKLLWPSLTKISWASFRPASPWHFCLWVTDHGTNVEFMTSPEKNWAELVKESRNIDCTVAPLPLTANRYLLALFLILFPYRGLPEVIRLLGWQYDSNWFIDMQ